MRAAPVSNPKVRIIDARPPDQYAAGHIPGAVNLSGFGGIPRAANGDMASAEDFARVAGSLGIGNDATLVVYDAPSQMMGMVAWAFLYYGHHDVRLLDGGFHKWTQEGRAVSTQATSYPQTVFRAQPVEGDLLFVKPSKVFSRPSTDCFLGHAFPSRVSRNSRCWLPAASSIGTDARRSSS